MSEAQDKGTSRRTFFKVAGVAAAGTFAVTRLFRTAWAGETPGAMPAPARTEEQPDVASASPEPDLPTPGWQRFTERARRIVFFAQEEAARLGENSVGPEHLLLGLVRENDSVAARILERLGVPLGRIRSDIERQVTRGHGNLGQDMQLTRSGKRVIDLAYDEARQLNNNYIGTEHLLLGLIREGDGLAARVLVKLGADLERTRREVYAMQEGENQPSHNRSPRDEMRRCVLCGKFKEQVPKLILGLHGGICTECINLCNDVIKGDS
jgi:Clp amino terminal domain, pathogenicity island component/ClpX C4-type zinc finger